MPTYRNRFPSHRNRMGETCPECGRTGRSIPCVACESNRINAMAVAHEAREQAERDCRDEALCNAEREPDHKWTPDEMRDYLANREFGP